MREYDEAGLAVSGVGLSVSLHLNRRTGMIEAVTDNNGNANAEQLAAIRRAVVGQPVGPAFRFVRRLADTLAIA